MNELTNESKPEQKQRDHHCGACGTILPDTPCDHENVIFCADCQLLSHYQRTLLRHLHMLVIISLETSNATEDIAGMVYEATGPHDEDDEPKEALVS